MKVESLTGIKRGEPPAPLSALTVDAIFRTAKDAVGSADAAQPAEQVVFRVTDIVVPKLDAASEDVKQTQETLDARALGRRFRRVYQPARRPRSASPSIKAR